MTQMSEETATALVLGATGGIGGAVAKALLARGWRVKALTRRAPKEMARKLPDIARSLVTRWMPAQFWLPLPVQA